MEPAVYLNPSARKWTFEPDGPASEAVLIFHKGLPESRPTPLHSLSCVAADLGLGYVLLKDESNRFGLPSFKILGASWAVYRTLLSALDARTPISGGTISLDDLGARAKQKGLKLITTTEGNWGRAVARMAKYLDIPALIYVPSFMPEATRAKLRGEGADVKIVDGSYDDCVGVVQAKANAEEGLLMVMDTGWAGYEQIPQWVVEGYSTMLDEADRQVREATGGKSASHAIVPVGVGSIAQAVVQHHKSSEKQSANESARVLTVEPDTAAGLKTSIATGHITTVSTGDSIMCGMNCGTVSTTAWPVLKAGVDSCLTVTDRESHEAVQQLRSQGVNAGPCGAATLAALRRACAQARDELGLDHEAVVVLYCTEGPREYEIPL